MGDRIREPEHYTSHPSGIECIEVAAWFPFAIGSAIKYLWRAGLKREHDEDSTAAAVRDLRKAQQFIAFEIARLETGSPLPKTDPDLPVGPDLQR